MNARNPITSSLASLVLLAAMALPACKTAGGGGGSTATADPKTDDEKVLYALGNQMGQSIKNFMLSPAELDMVKSGISDAVMGNKAKVDSTEYQMKVRTLYMDRSKAAAEKNKKKGDEWADKEAKQAGAQKTASGLVYLETKAGTGETPGATDRVKVNYEGKLVDGTVFDSSYKRNQPAEFPLNGVIPCWTEGLQKMKVGGKAKILCPAAIAYGDRGSPPNVPGGSTLQFEVELLGVEKAPATPPTPPGAPGMSIPGHGPGTSPGANPHGGTPPGGATKLPPGHP